MKIAVIGGTRGLGKWIAGFLKGEGFRVVITGRDRVTGENASRELGVEYCHDNVRVARDSDIVIISVPIENTFDVIREVAPVMRRGSLLVDVTSVKEEPARLMEELVPEGVDVLPTHPMFGPRIRSLAGQVVVLTPLRRSEWVDRAVSFLRERGARVLVTSPEKHDRMMSVVQVLTHFAYISIALTIRGLGVDVGESRRFASPIYNLMLDTIARIVSQNPYLAYSIQVYNRYGERVRGEFMGAVERLEDLLRREDRDSFVRWMSFAAKSLDDVEASLGRSDKAIFALNRELDVLKDSIGKEVGLKHIYSGNVHVGVLESVDPDFAVLRVGKRRVKLKVSNIRVLGREKLWDWKVENLPRRTYDISAMFPEGCDPEIIREVIEGLDGVVKAHVIDIYRGDQIPSGMVSVTFRFEVIDPGVYEKVRGLLEGFGAIIR
ncbi:MAG TPA: prephenate dehydrogenase [Methanothermobacter sp.]|jgi:prephenate dehydrogenase|nr:prephenate dehydrogenase [Methanothermobacter sp.]HHW16438.1 prephenate dehydrogenase [Methanothermobacter sp.]